MILHLLAEVAEFSDVCSSAAFICGFCRCKWNLYGSECLDISGGLLSVSCIFLSTEAETLSAFLLLETAARRSRTVTVVIDRVSVDDARARQRTVGGALMTISVASLPFDATERRSVDARRRVIDWSWRCAVLERF